MAASLKYKRTPITTPPYQVPSVDVTPDPPIFSLVTTFNITFDCMKNCKFFKFIYFAMAIKPLNDIRFIQCCTYVLNLKYFKLSNSCQCLFLIFYAGIIGIYLNSFLFYIAVGELHLGCYFFLDLFGTSMKFYAFRTFVALQHTLNIICG